jgi:hypothetical protein
VEVWCEAQEVAAAYGVGISHDVPKVAIILFQGNEPDVDEIQVT